MDAQWDDLKTVLHLVRARSLAGAAATLNVNYTTVARRVTRAEAALGQTLFERLPDGYRPTEAGEAVARQAAEMEAREFDLMRALGQQQTALAGPLTLTASQLLCSEVLMPVFETFCARYPEIDLRVRATNAQLDLNRREADLAIRISNLPGDSLTGLRLARQETASFASPDWARRIEEDPGGRIDWVVYSGIGTIPKAALDRYPGCRIRMMFDDMIALTGAARAGLGVVRMPLFLGRACDDLVQVPLLPPQPYADIWCVAHPDVWPSARVRAFRDCLVPFFRANRARFVD